MKRITAFILTFAMLLALFPMGVITWADDGTAEPSPIMPFYTVNWSKLDSDFEYVYHMPFFYANEKDLTTGITEIPISALGYGSDLATIAANIKKDFNNRPDGTRYISLSALATAFNNLNEGVIFMDTAVTLIADWLQAFLYEYSSIGGKLDGIIVDVEYNEAFYHYIYSKQYYTGNQDVYRQIVAHPKYAERMRPKLVARGFEFLPEEEQTRQKSEIWTIFRYTNKGGIAACQSIWDAAVSELMTEYINEAVYEPLCEYYPDAILSDYHRMDCDSWYKHVSDSGAVIGYNEVKVGNTSNYNVTYGARPGSGYYEYENGNRTVYMTPPSFNDAVFEHTPFNMAMWDVNLMRRAYASTENKKINAWITFFNYNLKARGTISNTPYYSEIILHTGLLNPQPFLGYILPQKVAEKGASSADPNVGNYNYNVQVVNELMTELTRVAGAADRTPIEQPVRWNDDFLLSGMTAGGRNIWRITPDTTKISVEEFKISDKAPTFQVNGLTVTFPQGRIIEDGKISQVGTCGYWVETPEGVTPVITADADRFAKDPAFQETFESYKTGAFTTASVSPNTYWTVDGTAEIRENAGSKAVALTGDTTLTSQKIPQLVTAGDEFAKQQAWEVTVTIPASNYGEVKLLGCTTDDGFKISGGNVYCYNGNGDQAKISGVTLSAGTYTFKREVNFTNNKSSFYVYDADDTLLGSRLDVNTKSVTLPVSTITLSTTGAVNAVLLDNFKLQAIGVQTVFELFDTEYGQEMPNTTTNITKEVAYRVSWMNASDKAQKVEVKKNGQVIDTVTMAPGMDGVITGVVKATQAAPVTLTVSDPVETSISQETIDTSTDWTTYADNLGISCIIEETGYATLEEAITAAQSGQTIVLLGDVEVDAPIQVDKKIEILGAGRTISASNAFTGDYLIQIVGVGDLTLGKGLTVNAGANSAVFVSSGTLRTEDVDILSDNVAVYVEQDEDQTPIDIQISGGMLQGSNYALCQHGNISGDVFVAVSDAAISGDLHSDKCTIKWDTPNRSFHLHWKIVDDPEVEATCTTTGLTAGSHYTCCGEAYVAQTVIPAMTSNLKHTWKEATCTEPDTCTVCGETKGDPKGHTWVMENDGLACEKCGIPQTIITASVTLLDKEYTIKNTGEARYFTTNTTTGAVTSVNMGAGSDIEPAYNIKLHFPAGSNTVKVYLKGATLIRGDTIGGCCITLGTDSNQQFNVEIIIEDDSTLTIQGAGHDTAGPRMGCINSNLAESFITTVTSVEKENGELAKLSLNGTAGKNKQRGFYATNNVVFKSANIVVNIPGTGTNYAAVHVKGNLTVDGGVLDVTHGRYAAIALLDSLNAPNTITGTAHTLTIQNRAEVTVSAGGALGAVVASGAVNIDNSTVTIIGDGSNRPIAVLNETSGKAYYFANVTNVDAYTSTDVTGETDLQEFSSVNGDTGTSYRYFQATPIDPEAERDIKASMSLAESLKFNFFIEAEKLTGVDMENLTAQVTHYYADDRGIVVYPAQVVGYTDENNVAWYRIIYDQLAAKEMMDTLEVEIFVDGESFAKQTDSVRGYIERTYKDYPGFHELFAAILHYGAGAQKQFGYNVNNLANANLPEALENVDFGNLDDADAQYFKENYANYAGMALYWENSIAVEMVFTGVDEDMYAVFQCGNTTQTVYTINDHGAKGKGFKFTGVTYSDASEPITVTVYDKNGNQHATATDSMESYIDRSRYVKGIMDFWNLCESTRITFGKK